MGIAICILLCLQIYSSYLFLCSSYLVRCGLIHCINDHCVGLYVFFIIYSWFVSLQVSLRTMSSLDESYVDQVSNIVNQHTMVMDIDTMIFGYVGQVHTQRDVEVDYNVNIPYVEQQKRLMAPYYDTEETFEEEYVEYFLGKVCECHGKPDACKCLSVAQHMAFQRLKRKETRICVCCRIPIYIPPLVVHNQSLFECIHRFKR